MDNACIQEISLTGPNDAWSLHTFTKNAHPLESSPFATSESSHNEKHLLHVSRLMRGKVRSFIESHNQEITRGFVEDGMAILPSTFGNT